MKITFDSRTRFNQAISVLTNSVVKNQMDIGYCDKIITFFNVEAFGAAEIELGKADVLSGTDYQKELI